jgi:ribosomal protein S18 acetylase RimI-like enzyme
MTQVTVRVTPRSEAALVAELGRRHREHWSGAPAGWFNEAFVLSSYEMPGLEPDNDFWTADLDGRFVGGTAVLHHEPYTEINVYSFIDPDLSDEQAGLVARRIIERAAESAQRYADRAAPEVEPKLSLGVFSGEPLREVARQAAFTYVRSSFVMRRSLTAAEVAPPLPEGVRARPIDVETDTAAVGEVVTAFADHHGDQVFTEEQMHHFMTGPSARPDLSRLAEDVEGPCGLVLCGIEPDGGTVGILATLKRARGRGIGTALLRQAFQALAGAGCTVVRLNVDAENTTGALRIYEGAGMTRESELEHWMRPIGRTVG